MHRLNNELTVFVNKKLHYQLRVIENKQTLIYVKIEMAVAGISTNV